MLESEGRNDSILNGLDALAEFCDAGTRVIVIGRTQRRHALSRAGAPRRQRLPDLAGRHDRRGALDLRPVLRARRQAGRPHHRRGRRQGRRRRLDRSPTTSPGRWRATSRSTRVVTDLDLAFGTAGLDYNQDPPQGIADAVFSPDRIDTAFVDRLLSKCTDHLSLLAAPATLERVYDFGAEAFDRIFDSLRATDALHRARRAAPVDRLDAAHADRRRRHPDRRGARSRQPAQRQEPVRSSARRARQRPPPVLLLNQVGVPKRPEIKPADFAKALEDEPVAVIPFEPQIVRHRRQQRPDDRRSVGRTTAPPRRSGSSPSC